MKKISEILVYYVLVPTYLLSGGYIFYKFKYLFPISVFIMFLIFLFDMDNRNTIIKDKITKENIFFLILFGYSLISLRNPIGAERSFLECFDIGAGFLMILIMQESIKKEEDFEKLLNIIKVIIFILSCHALIQYFQGERLTATYSNENRLTTFFVLVAPFYFSEIKNKVRFTTALTISSISIVTILAYSRFNILCLMFLFLELIYSKLKKIIKNKNNKLFSRIVSVGFIIIVIFGTFSIVQIGEKSITEQINSENSSLSQRFDMIVEGKDIFLESNLMGVGAGNLFVFDNTENKMVPISLHNHIMNLLSTYGLIGFISFVFMYYILVKDYFKLNRTFSESLYIDAIKLFMLVFIIASNSPSSLFRFRPFYFIFGFCFCIINFYDRRLVEND